MKKVMKGLIVIISLVIIIGTVLVFAVPKDQDDSIVFPDEYTKIMTQKTKYLEPRSTKTRPTNANNNRNTSARFYQLSLNIARSLAETDDIDSFVANLVENKEKFRQDQQEPFVGIASRFGETSKQNKAKLAPKASCIPQPEVVSLVPENHDPALMFIPECTRVNRCSGCCGTALLSCQPTKTTTKKFKVYELTFANKVSYKRLIEVSVEEHVECKCDCTTKKEDCRVQDDYIQSECRCGCSRNTREEEKKYQQCVSTSETFWDNRVCACRCIDNNNCDMYNY